jgi:hypothetical protein
MIAACARVADLVGNLRRKGLNYSGKELMPIGRSGWRIL